MLLTSVSRYGTSPVSNDKAARLEQPYGIHAISVTSRRLHTLANAVLYRSVVLGDERAVILFGQTVDIAREVAKSPPAALASVRASTAGRTITPEFLQSAIKRLAITFAPVSMSNFVFGFTSFKPATKVTNADIAKIISACAGVRTVAIPSHWARCLRDVGVPGQGQKELSDEDKYGERLGRNVTLPGELILSSFTELGQTRIPAPVIEQWRPSAPPTPVHSLPSTPVQTRPSSPEPFAVVGKPVDTLTDPETPPMPVLSHVTHLRIAEPASSWHSPLPLLHLFPALSHIALPRRANANADNDLLFLEGVKTVLQQKGVQMVVVVVFAQPGYYADQNTAEDSDAQENADRIHGVRASSIWQAVEEMRRSDKRVYVAEGSYGMWKQEWEGAEVVASARGPGDWWERTRRS
ncbi:hypothetical protein BV22DRAFT_1102862 [Leucogyrophana mollusca]|uniref:Uncharacterized protein n=1 Tax=Leucogyrophana mollusca TaxID=85980 RepID=A0ACB8BTZ7_9AGAM|nr:hypothetical protein BV22DRAFT_1102862 [Leucogyrophana mollusca]